MNSPIHKTNKSSALFAKLIFTSVLLFTASTAIAGKSNTAYVDSVHSWGAWELDIEPAAGGLQRAGTQALNARDSHINIRTNSIAALAPPSGAVPASPAIPTTTPAIPATPPTITPVRPGVQIPVGGPGI